MDLRNQLSTYRADQRYQSRQQNIDTFNPTGFIDRTTSTMSFTDLTYTFEIAPVGDSFEYYQLGTKYTVSTQQSIAIDDSQYGLHAFYFDGATLTTVFNPSEAQVETIITQKTLISFIYWDADLSENIMLGEERHGCSMSGHTHYYLHNTFGTQFWSGAALTDIVADGNGDLDVSAQFGVASGVIADEDIILDLDTVDSETGLPIFYKSGVSGNWKRIFDAGFSVATTGSGRAAWNEFTGGTWQLSEVSNNDFVLVHVWAVNDLTYPYIAVVGQDDYLTLSQARAGALVELSDLILGGLPFVEFKPIATIIYQTSNGYDNGVKSRVRRTDTGDDYIDWRQTPLNPSQGSIVSHNQLSDVTVDNHHPQYPTAGDTTAMLAIATPAVGQYFFNTDWGQLVWWDGDVWLCGKTIKLANQSGVTLAVGDVVIFHQSQAISVNRTTTANDINVAGVVATGGANAAFITIAIRGLWDVSVTATTAIGDGLFASTTAGAAAPAAHGSVGEFAQAVAARTGAGLVKAALIGTELT